MAKKKKYRGHRSHICKSCSKLSVEKRNELARMRKIGDIEFSGFYLSKKDRDLLKKYRKDKRYSDKVRGYAARVLENAEIRYQEMQEAKKQEEELYEDLLEDDIEEYDEDIYSDDELPF